jgi:membrane-associated protein
MSFLNLLFHIDRYLELLIGAYGSIAYIILFAVIFVETGLVLAPFLPGDSLIFAAGVLSARGLLSIYLVIPLLIAAAILGDSLNYFIGKFFGQKAAESKRVNKKYLLQAHEFFRNYGGKAIFFGRFVPIIRTFVPFVAGLSSMNYRKFLAYNVLGAVVWVLLFSFLGLVFGNLPFVKNNFSVIIIAIIFLSLLPILIEYLRKKL